MAGEPAASPAREGIISALSHTRIRVEPDLQEEL
jgi:hypothetical protein